MTLAAPEALHGVAGAGPAAAARAHALLLERRSVVLVVPRAGDVAPTHDLVERIVLASVALGRVEYAAKAMSRLTVTADRSVLHGLDVVETVEGPA
jgi:hypothetical protein